MKEATIETLFLSNLFTVSALTVYLNTGSRSRHLSQDCKLFQKLLQNGLALSKESKNIQYSVSLWVQIQSAHNLAEENLRIKTTLDMSNKG